MLKYRFVVDEPAFASICEAQGWKRPASIARALGVPMSTVTRIRRGERYPSGEFVASFAMASGAAPGAGFRVVEAADAAA